MDLTGGEGVYGGGGGGGEFGGEGGIVSGRTDGIGVNGFLFGCCCCWWWWW